jgi:predicted AlkP superfamily phosphohydrolase/phosphomutase
MTTGVNPGKHGIFSFFEVGEGSVRTVNSTGKKWPSIWHLLSTKRKRVIVVNVPVTFPPDPVNGILITDMLTPAGATVFTYPDFMSKVLLRKGHNIGLPFRAGEGIPRDTNLSELSDSISQRFELFEWLLTQFDWDFSMIVFNEIDYAHHLFAPPAILELTRLYQEFDRGLSSLLGVIPRSDTTIFVVSDHGFNRATRAFRVNDWLSQIGLLHQNQTRKLSSRSFQIVADLGLRNRYVSELAHAAKRRTGKRFTKFMDKSVLLEEETVNGLRSVTVQPHKYVLLHDNAQNFSSEKLLSVVREQASRLVDESTGEKPIVEVLSRERLYNGMASVRAPDMVLKLKENYMACERMFGTKRLFHPINATVHEPEGILIVAGKGISSNATFGSPPMVWDIAPTVLHLLGVKNANGMDGRFMSEILIETPSRESEILPTVAS